MDTKPLTFGIIGFLLGGLVVSTAAVLDDGSGESGESGGSMSMAEMSADLEDRSGDDFDAAFLTSMVEHHEAAVEMAQLSADRAEHDELVRLSDDIVAAQQSEIEQMRQWYEEWGYAG